MEILRLNEIKMKKTKMGTRIDYNYDMPEKMQKYIKGTSLFVEFPCDMRDVPLGILTIPFVGVMATVTMLLNIKIHVPVLEKEFMDNIAEIAKIYEKMYPGSKFNLSVQVDELETNEKESLSGSALFFTGGVDATSALIGLLERRPILVNIWGGDLRLTDNDSHEELEGYLKNITRELNLRYCFIKTNGREMFREDELGYLTTKYVGKRNEYGWWATIAHTLSMSASTVPWMWKNNIETIYLGSTHATKENSYDANNSELLNAIGSKYYKIAIADGEFVRNEKVERIVKWKKEMNVPLQLKVCWKRTAGENCCACEKCYRTILNIISNFGDPNELGFEVDENVLLEIKNYLETHHVGVAFWEPIRQAFLSESEYWIKRPEISWILTFKFNSFQTIFPRIKRKFLRKL